MSAAAAMERVVVGDGHLVEGRVPPHDLDAEAAVLSGAMNDATSLDIAAEVLTKLEHFYSEAHRRIWEACLYLHAAGERVDVTTVAGRLRVTDRLAQVGGMSYLTTVLNAAPALAGVRQYAETVRDRYMARQAILVCQRFTSEGYGGYGRAFGDASGYVGAIAKAIFDIESDGTSTELRPVGAILHSALKRLGDAAARGARITGTPTGFDRYDRITSGLHNGELTIVAARPGMGKTSLVLDIAQNVAAYVAPVRAGEPLAPRCGVAIFSIEMPDEPVGLRMLCSRARVDVSKVRSGMLSQTDWQRLTQAAGELHQLPIFIDDSSGITLMQMRAKVRRKAAEWAAKKLAPGEAPTRLGLVVVDYLQLMQGEEDEKSREREVAKLSRGFKILAKDLDTPVVALSQLNRAVETRGKSKRPQLSDLRESGAIEQDADNICFIYRDEYYEKETAERNIAELIIAKQRNGPLDTVKVRWDGIYTRFDNLADGEWEGDDYHG